MGLFGFGKKKSTAASSVSPKEEKTAAASNHIKENIIEQKRAMVEDLSEKMRDSVGIVFLDYRGLTVEQDTKLRKEMRESGCNYGVYKNIYINAAMNKLGYGDPLDEMLNCGTAVGYSKTNAEAPARIVTKYSKLNSRIEIKGGVYYGRVIDSEEVKEIGNLPSKDLLYTRLAWILKNAKQ